MKALSLFPSVMLSTEFSHVVILIALSCYKQHGKIAQFNHVFFLNPIHMMPRAFIRNQIVVS